MKKIKRVKGCFGCIHYRQFYCSLIGISKSKRIPYDVLTTNKCNSRKKNKHIYF